MHPVLRGPHRRRVGSRAPPDTIAQSGGMRLEPKQAGRVGKHRPWIRSRESLSFQKVEKNLGVLPTQVRVGAAFRWRVAEVTPPFDDLLWRAAADPELQPAVAD